MRLFPSGLDLSLCASEREGVTGLLGILVSSSMNDISLFARDEPALFAAKTRDVVVMGGCHPVLD